MVTHDTPDKNKQRPKRRRNEGKNRIKAKFHNPAAAGDRNIGNDEHQNKLKEDNLPEHAGDINSAGNHDKRGDGEKTGPVKRAE